MSTTIDSNCACVPSSTAQSDRCRPSNESATHQARASFQRAGSGSAAARANRSTSVPTDVRQTQAATAHGAGGRYPFADRPSARRATDAVECRVRGHAPVGPQGRRPDVVPDSLPMEGQIDHQLPGRRAAEGPGGAADLDRSQDGDLDFGLDPTPPGGPRRAGLR